MPNGVTVELLGVAESPSKDRPWWRPDGSPLAGRPYDSLDDAMVAGQFEIVRELAFRLDNLPAEPVSTIWRFGAGHRRHPRCCDPAVPCAPASLWRICRPSVAASLTPSKR